MKKICCIIFSLISGITFGQDYPRIDTLNFGNNVKHVKHFMQYDDKEEMLLESFWFNDFGKHTITYSGYKSETQSRILYEYNKNGYLTSIKMTYYISPYNDSIKNLLNAEVRAAYLSKGTNDSEIEWSRISAKYDTIYKIVNPEKVEWNSRKEIHPSILIKRNQFGQDSLIEIYSGLNNNELYLDEIISFSYNKQNRLIKKRWIDVPHKNVLKLQAFKSSSTEFEDSIKLLSGTYREKCFIYSGDTLKIQYFVNGSFSGHELQTTVANIRKELVFNTKNDTLSYFVNTFDSNNLLICKHRVRHTGYNGFGYSMDLAGSNIEKYKYDSKNRLIRIDVYNDDKHLYVERFQIMEK